MDKFAGQLHSQPSGAGRHARPLGGLGAFSPARRLTALLLAGALMLGLGLTAGAEQLQPTQVAPDDFPYITVETNLVMNEASKLPQVIEVEEDGAAKEYGFIEVALRVGPGSGTEEQMLQVFAALAYDSTILTPVTWNAANPDTKKRDLYQVIDATAAAPATPLVYPALKADVMDTGAARILGEDEDDYVAFSLLAGVDNVPTTLKGTADEPTTLHGDSRLVAVRFRYDAAAHPFSYDADAKEILDNSAPLARPLIVWANDANAAGSDGGMSVAYVGGTADEQMYFVAEAPDPTDTTKWTVVDGLNKPTTSSVSIIKAVDAAGTGYSYESNFFPVEDNHLTNLGLPAGEPRIRFTQVMGPTADQGSGGISLDDLSTILFYDWDDTLLGALTVPKGVDVRETVNDYVRDNFIHPELRYDKDDPTAPNPDLDSVARKDSYRGTFPYDNPGGAEFSGTGIKEDADGDGEVDANAGSRFPLTNKLDYVFFKQKAYFDEDEGFWILDGADEEYPYVYGWQSVNNPDTMPDVWTTFGVAELEEYYRADGGFVTDGTADYYEITDFTKIRNRVQYVKAVYEPAEVMSELTFYTPTKPKYTRYTVAGGVAGGTYSISYAYRRVGVDNLGVIRLREPTVQFGMEPDVHAAGASVIRDTNDHNALIQELWDLLDEEIFGGTIEDDLGPASDFQMMAPEVNAGYVYVELAADKNDDVIEVDLTPTSYVLDISYYLVEKHGANFMSGLVCSEGKELGVPTNFDYENYSYEERLGTSGFIFLATKNLVLEYGSTEKRSIFERYVTEETLADLNLKADASGTPFGPFTIMEGQRRLYDGIQRAVGNGWVDAETGWADLTWRQIQYCLINDSLQTDDYIKNNCNYSWYRGPVE